MTHFVNPKEVEGDLVAHLVELTDGGADYCFECVGNVNLMRQALECATRAGAEHHHRRAPAPGKEIAPGRSSSLPGGFGRAAAFGGARGRTDVPRIVDWYMEGKINIDDLITHTLPLERINEGFDLMHRGERIRSVVVYQAGQAGLPAACRSRSARTPGGSSDGCGCSPARWSGRSIVQLIRLTGGIRAVRDAARGSGRGTRSGNRPGPVRSMLRTSFGRFGVAIPFLFRCAQPAS